MAWLKDRLRRCEPAPAVGDRRLAPCPAGQPPGAGEQQPDPSMAPDILYGCRRPPGCPPALPGRVADAHACHAAHAHALCDGVGSGEGCPCHAALAMPLLFLCLPWLTLHGALLLLPSVPSAQRAPSPAPQPSALGAAAPCPAPGPALVRTVSPGPKHRYRGSTFNPPYIDMHGWHPTERTLKAELWQKPERI